MTKNQWIEVLKEKLYVNTDNDHEKEERSIRKAISELRKQGIIYVPVRPHFYIRVEGAGIEDVENFAKAQVKALATQYFNTVKPLKDYVADEKLKAMMNHFSFLEQPV